MLVAQVALCHLFWNKSPVAPFWLRAAGRRAALCVTVYLCGECWRRYVRDGREWKDVSYCRRHSLTDRNDDEAAGRDEHRQRGQLLSLLRKSSYPQLCYFHRTMRQCAVIRYAVRSIGTWQFSVYDMIRYDTLNYFRALECWLVDSLVLEPTAENQKKTEK